MNGPGQGVLALAFGTMSAPRGGEDYADSDSDCDADADVAEGRA